MMIKSDRRSRSKLARPTGGPSLGSGYIQTFISLPSKTLSKVIKSPRFARLHVSYLPMNRGQILVTHPSHHAGASLNSRFAVAVSAMSESRCESDAMPCAARRDGRSRIARRIEVFPLCDRDSHALAVATAGIFLPLIANRDSRVFVDIPIKKEVHNAQ